MGKKNNKTIDIFGATNSLKVLSYLVQHPGREFLNSEVQKAVSASRIGVYFTLKDLVRQGLVSQERRGKFLFYRIVSDNIVIKQFKVLKNVLALQSIVFKLKSSSRKITLYGSYSRGENDASSDIDLFILAKDPETTKDAISSIKTKQKIQAVIKTAAEMASFKESEKVFMQEVERGVVLWEEKE